MDIYTIFKDPVFEDRKTKYLKTSFLPKLIYRFTAIPIKAPIGFFMEYSRLF